MLARSPTNHCLVGRNRRTSQIGGSKDTIGAGRHSRISEQGLSGRVGIDEMQARIGATDEK